MRVFQLGNSKNDIWEMIPERKIKKVRLGDKEVAVLRLKDTVYAFEPFCPHRGASLLTAFTNAKEEIICPLHQYRFDLKTGQVKSGYCREMEVYPCSLDENGLTITIPQ
ncbi:non-heme iron oxygenase ferredoxin subunit [Algoriphagus sp. oki45]|uniref:Rieske (2Fe-2S) protein n=1 Tax=Algoriphagus sp. oki45 TaxID=3067294 RepID=UPI0027F6F004|nr:non-heme iron oxygenase ferredoxin subunit [Algoriphagus sp. oki45]